MFIEHLLCARSQIPLTSFIRNALSAAIVGKSVFGATVWMVGGFYLDLPPPTKVRCLFALFSLPPLMPKAAYLIAVPEFGV